MFSPAKKFRLFEASLRPDLVKDDVINRIKSCWTDSSYEGTSKLEGLGVEIVRNPFPVCIVQNFISNLELLKAVVEEAKNVPFNDKILDLFHFKQSPDVQNLKNYAFIPQLYGIMKNEALNWVNETLGNNRLKKTMSATFSSYSYQDRLLCHDDKCEDRHFAFILYLVEDWTEDDGGALQLFNTCNDGFPRDVVRSIIPEFNTIVLFEVTRESFHQVCEVTSKTKNRLSLNGWFHSLNKIPDQEEYLISILKKNFANNKDFKLEDYLSPVYFDEVNKRDIKDKFVKDSEIQLGKFFNPKFWETIVNDIKSSDIKWSFVGPANMRKYEVAETSSLPDSIKVVKEIFESKCWFRYLKELTGLGFAPSENSDLQIWESGIPPDCSCEVQRWTPSCYTLVYDNDAQFHSKSLDVILRIPFQKDKNVDDYENEDTPEAGHIIYIDADSKTEECLLHVGYKMNSLALIFRDKKTLRFTKYLTSTAEPFYQIFCIYRRWRPPKGQPKLKHCEGESESENSSDSYDSNEDEQLSE